MVKCNSCVCGWMKKKWVGVNSYSISFVVVVVTSKRIKNNKWRWWWWNSDRFFFLSKGFFLWKKAKQTNINDTMFSFCWKYFYNFLIIIFWNFIYFLFFCCLIYYFICIPWKTTRMSIYFFCWYWKFFSLRCSISENVIWVCSFLILVPWKERDRESWNKAIGWLCIYVYMTKI